MAAALFRGGAGLCVRCIHRELCRLVWRPQTALYSSRPSDRKPPRRTHIKKAKPQPALDVAKLLEQLFSQRRLDTAPPAGKAQTAKASSTATKPPTSNVPPSSKTEPAVPVFPAASSLNQDDGVPKKTTSTFNTAPPSPQPTSLPPTNPQTSYSSETPQQSPPDFIQAFAADSVSSVTVPPTSTKPASLESEAAAKEWQTWAETIETNVETATEPAELETATVPPSSAHTEENNVETSPFSVATVEPLIETTVESPVEPRLSPVETLEVRAAVVGGPVEPAVDAPAEEVQTKGTNSGLVDVSQTTEEPLIETTMESRIEASHIPVETLETRDAVVEGPIEPTIDVTVDIAGGVNISNTTAVEPLVETTIERSVEASTSPVETLESRAAVVECPVEPTVDATVETAAQAVQTNSTDSGILSHVAEVEPLIETTVEASTSPLETLDNRTAVAEGSVETKIETEADTAAQTVQTNSRDPGVVNISPTTTVEPLVETTVEPAVEASTPPLESRAAVAECLVEPTVDTPAEAVQTNSTDSGPVNISHIAEVQPLIETTTEASTSPLETLENRAAVSEGSVKTTIKTETQTAAQAVQTKSGDSAVLNVSYSAKEEPLIETTLELALEASTSPLESRAAVSEGTIEPTEGNEAADNLKELLCHVPAVLCRAPDTVGTSSASGPPVGAREASLQREEKTTEAEAMTLESITLAKVKAEVGGLRTEVLLEIRDALEKEAEVLAKEEKMDVETTGEDVAVFEDTADIDILTLDSISEATDAIEAETSVILEAMFGSEQGPRQPPDTVLVDQKQDKVIGQEAENESAGQGGKVWEAMTLESVTLAEVEASLGTLENEALSETSDYLEKEAEILAVEKRVEVEEGVASEETAEALTMEFLSLPEGDALSEALQTDALMEELLFSVPWHVAGGPTGQEAGSANILDATVASGSVDVDTAAAATDDFPDAVEELQLGQEVEEETEAWGIEDGGKETHTDLDPVQRLFLEKIREYNNLHRLNKGLLEVEPDYEKYLSEETAKLQRLYGGGDLSRFPQFTFTEPEMDQDSK